MAAVTELSPVVGTQAACEAPRCFVKLYGVWYEWQGSCSDWSAYFNAGYGGNGGLHIPNAGRRPPGRVAARQQRVAPQQRRSKCSINASTSRPARQAKTGRYNSTIPWRSRSSQWV